MVPHEVLLVLTQCNGIWAREDLVSVRGHGFRIAGLLTFLLLGVNLWVVMVQGGGPLSHSCPTGTNARRSFCSSSVFHFIFMILFYLL